MNKPIYLVYGVAAWVVVLSAFVWYDVYTTNKEIAERHAALKQLQENNAYMRAYIIQQEQLFKVYKSLVELVKEKANEVR